MPAAVHPATEAERLDALRSYDVLDTQCEAVFDDLTRLAARLTGMPIALISLVDADRQWFKSRIGLDAQQTPRDLAFCAHAVLDPDRPLIVPDARQDARFADNLLVTGAPHVRAYAGVPLVNPDGHALGTLCVIDRVPHALTAEQQETLSILGRAVMTALDLRRALSRARGLALTDALTGLANRRSLVDAIERAIARQSRDGQPFGLIYLDLDGFKTVNDRHGHAAGDAVLQTVAAALLQRARRDDLVARLGGDEFAILLTGGAIDVTIETVAEAARHAVRLRTAALTWPVTASLGGVTFFTAPDDAAAVLATADQVMYTAKTAGRDTIRTHAHGAPAQRSLHPADLALSVTAH